VGGLHISAQNPHCWITGRLLLSPEKVWFRKSETFCTPAVCCMVRYRCRWWTHW